MPLNTQVVVPAQVKLPGSSLSADEIVAKFTGTPNGALFLRDDGTLAAAGGTDASALTTGTLPAARLPGVLANVDTQAELLSAAAAAPLASPTFTGTVTSPATNLTGPLTITTPIPAGSSSAIQMHTLNLSNRIYLNVPAGGYVVLSVNGGDVFYASTDGIACNYKTSIIGHLELRGPTSNGGNICHLYYDYNSNLHTYSPWGHVQTSLCQVRTASTAYAICDVATGDKVKAEIGETSIADCLVFVNADGSISLYDRIGGTASASIVNSSSPGATEYGVYISAGKLYFKGGSSYAGRMGHHSRVWKA